MEHTTLQLSGCTPYYNPLHLAHPFNITVKRLQQGLVLYDFLMVIILECGNHLNQNTAQRREHHVQGPEAHRNTRLQAATADGSGMRLMASRPEPGG